ncbi:salicylate 1-hydroxylase-like protein [Cucurbitaria berberidis CBS 394.84]|uniref:Salicylate 1-hydroxylase-like protein n=1 Tax=Cucurbitaria berberidis CBS 394.84 TaxID=1168544 RepID=A0A9P4LBA8_9PLEO|nr:salicylate 1-hydroxylase-like protein [Cucurbitaria berberidis CBS 394.84]KAF1848182.1 salicylate 1-hydroxylase-like protein [Cucurbitaria berberidis CBS 394.84]
MSDTPSHAQKTPTLAIIGGGIAGLTLTIALLKHAPSIPITLYESASAFGEIGAGVGFEPVMVRTMGLIDPRIAAAFEKCSRGNTVTDPPKWFTVRVGDQRKIVGDEKDGVVLEKSGENKKVRLGEEIFTIPAHRGPRGGIHRAHFLDELVKLVPDGIAQFRKKLAHVTEAEDGSGDAVLHFADGSTAQHSAVLGCDGIKSRTRSLVLGNSDSTAAVFSGKYVYRGLIPMTKAIEIMGEDQPKTPQMYVGYHGHVLTFPIANGTILNVVAFSSRPTWTDPNWVVQTSREDMLEDYKHWSPMVRSIMVNLQSFDIWALFNHLPAPIYYRSSPLICLVGDAAHATTPHQGAGAGMCIEDVYILSELLSQCKSKTDLEEAFRAYDAVRRPRSQKLVKTSREAGMLWEFEGEGVGDDLEALERNATTRMAWLWDHDISTDLQKARAIIEEKISS